MSRIGKLPIVLPSGVTATIEGRSVKVKGPKGELIFVFTPEVSVKLAEGTISVEMTGKTKNAPALWGTTRATINNMVRGVSEGFEKKLELHGVGYKMAVQGKKMVLNLGFSHPVELAIPDGVTAAIEREFLTITGFDKQKVGQFAAQIRSYRPVEPYKGKGFRYSGEFFIKKEGKKAGSEK